MFGIFCNNYIEMQNKGNKRWPPNDTKTEKSTHPNCVNMVVAIKKTYQTPKRQACDVIHVNRNKEEAEKKTTHSRMVAGWSARKCGRCAFICNELFKKAADTQSKYKNKSKRCGSRAHRRRRQRKKTAKKKKKENSPWQNHTHTHTQTKRKSK